MAQNLNPNLNANIVPSGINKHVYSTNPDGVVEENLYTRDGSSMNKQDTFQTLDNKTIPVGTGEKVNPFNVKGVPGCKHCGGSGWKEGKHPHPCNECAKKTVPIIDTYLTKVGQTATPIVENVPITRTVEVTDYVEQVRTVPVTREVEVTKTVPVTKNVPVTENVSVTTNVPVTRNVEVMKEVPVTKNVQYTENVPVKTQVPVTHMEEMTKNVPVTKTKQVVENVPMTTTVPVTQNVSVTKNVPVTKTKQVIENVPVKTNVPVTEQVEVTRTVPVTKYVDVTENVPETIRVRHIGETVGASTITTQMNNMNLGTNSTLTTGTLTGMSGLSTTMFRGVPGCKLCGGEGLLKSKSGHGMKPCKDCVKMTGNCPACNNTGMRLDKNKKCSCIYAK